MTKTDGYLFAKLAAIGTRSEGPAYFLQKSDYEEIPVIKKVPLWEDEPELHKRLATKVTVVGDRDAQGIRFESVEPQRVRP